MSKLPVVLTNANQSFTDTQKAQGRTNIGAASTSDLSTEVTNRSNADTTLQNNIDNEASARAHDDSTLSTQIGTVANNLTSEQVIRNNTDTALSDRINTEITNRQSADGALSDSLTTEVNARQSADITLTAAVAGKQDKLTAGTNITITNNVISATHRTITPDSFASVFYNVSATWTSDGGVTKWSKLYSLSTVPAGLYLMSTQIYLSDKSNFAGYYNISDSANGGYSYPAGTFFEQNGWTSFSKIIKITTPANFALWGCADANGTASVTIPYFKIVMSLIGD